MRNIALAVGAILFLGLAIIIYSSSKTKPAETVNFSISPVPTVGASPKSDNTMNDKLKIEDIKEGEGDPVKQGDTVEVNYTGTLPDGKKFDSSYDRNQTFSFTVGAGQVIQGWELGLIGMKKGGVRKLTIPSSLGYGEQGVPGAIPANSPLIFEIQLVSINP